MATDSVARGTGPENTKYDQMRHESIRLRPNGMYGIPKFFVNGLKEDKPRCLLCGKLLCWCECEKR